MKENSSKSKASNVQISSVFTERAGDTRAPLDLVSSWWKPMDSVEKGPTQS